MKKSIFCILISILLLFSATACGNSANKFKITFDGNGGLTADGLSQVVVEVTEGESFMSPTFIYEGYEFIGWDVDNFNNIKTDTTVKAQWQKKINVVVVRFDLDGGSVVSGSLTQEVEKGGNAVEPTAIKYGYTFNGWNLSLENITEDAVITAKWKANRTIIDFNEKGGTHCNVIEVDFGDVLSLPVPTWITSDGLFGEEKSFVGWYYLDKENNNQKVTISSGDVWNVDERNITFYAEWKSDFTQDNV